MKEMDMKDDEKTNLVRWKFGEMKFWGENERVAMFQKTPKPRTPAFLQFLSPLPYDIKEAVQICTANPAFCCAKTTPQKWLKNSA